MNAAEPASTRWEAFLQLDFKAGSDKTRMVPVKRYGPLSVQRAFYPEDNVCHSYLLHPPGGVVGGDKLDLNLDLEPESHALITTPGATKFYFSAGDTAHVSQNIKAHSSASLEFLPQENIYFPGARVNMTTCIEVSNDSRFMLWEKHCFGRPANNETFHQGQVISRLELEKDKQLLFTDTQRIDESEINRASGLRSNPVMGSCLVYGLNLNKDLLESCRALQLDQGYAGITQHSEHICVIRYMGNSTLQLNNYFVALWNLLRPALFKRESCAPRIWST